MAGTVWALVLGVVPHLLGRPSLRLMLSQNPKSGKKKKQKNPPELLDPLGPQKLPSLSLALVLPIITQKLKPQTIPSSTWEGGEPGAPLRWPRALHGQDPQFGAPALWFSSCSGSLGQGASAGSPYLTPHPFSFFFLVFRELALASTLFQDWSVTPAPSPGTWLTQGVLEASACPSSCHSSGKLPLQLQRSFCRRAGAYGG